jgi:hypothetical protein
MDCKLAREQMNDLLDGELDDAARGELGLHVLECPACTRELADLQAVHSWAADVPLEEPRPGFADRVMARIVEEPQRVASRRIPTGAGALVTLVLAAVAAMAGVPLILGAGESVRNWGIAALDTMRGWVTVTGSDFASLGRNAAGELTAVWSRFEQFEGFVPAVWLVGAATTGLLLMIAFNLVQARATGRRYHGRP